MKTCISQLFTVIACVIAALHLGAAATRICVALLSLCLAGGALAAQHDEALFAAARDGDVIAAARNGDAAMVTLLLEAGADPDKVVRFDGSPLIQAVRSGDTAIVNLLIENGADVNGKGDWSRLRRRTPLNQVPEDKPDVRAQLLAAGAR